MPEPLIILPEPELEFRYGQKLHDPHDGLFLFGPYDTDMPSHPKNITYGVVGTREGIDAFEKWSKRVNLPVYTDKGKNKLLWPPYAGFEPTYYSTLSLKPSWIVELDRNKLVTQSLNLDANKRAFGVVNAYLEGIKVIRKRDESFNLIICIVPDEVYKNCRPESFVKDGVGFSISKYEKDRRIKGQTHLFDNYDPEEYQLSVDFRRQLKARAMEFGIPLQIILDSTLGYYPSNSSNHRGLTPESDIAWNLSTTIFYKSGGKPWRLSTARDGVCYVGIAFRRTDISDKGRTACCAAQMFLDTGDGIVFLGEYGPWYSPSKRECHLSKDSARNLLSGVLRTYEQLEGRKLTEVFLHSRSSIDEIEFNGYRDACPPGIKVIGVRVRSERTGLKLFRCGEWPVLRGTFLKLNNRSGLLWGSGYKPRLGTYDGWEVPVPLRIDIEHGDADIEQVVKDIFGLTKLNYNACKLGESEPVTVGFSDAVGEILVSNPAVDKIKPNFKFYI